MPPKIIRLVGFDGVWLLILVPLLEQFGFEVQVCKDLTQIPPGDPYTTALYCNQQGAVKQRDEIRATCAYTEAHPSIVIVGEHISPQNRQRVVMHGRPIAILTANTSSDCILREIRRIANGDREFFDDDPLLTFEGKYGQSEPKPPKLSSREEKIVALVAQRKKNKEIAEALQISEQTVKNHLHNIFDKLGFDDRTN